MPASPMTEPRDAVVSGMTSTWPKYLMEGPATTRDYSRLDFAINLICLSALVETVAVFDHITTVSRAHSSEDLPYLGSNIPVSLIDPVTEVGRFLGLYGSSSAGASLSNLVYQSIERTVWYDTLRASRTHEDADAWRDVVATEFAAAVTLATEESCPIVHNVFEASLASFVDREPWSGVGGPSVFRRALSIARQPHDLLSAAVTMRRTPEADEFAAEITADKESDKPAVVSASPKGGTVWDVKRHRGQAVALVPPIDIDYGRVEAMFGVPAADVELQVGELVRTWRRGAE